MACPGCLGSVNDVMLNKMQLNLKVLLKAVPWGSPVSVVKKLSQSGTPFQSLVGELKSHKLEGTTNK